MGSSLGLEMGLGVDRELVSLSQCFPATSSLHLMTALHGVALGEAAWSSRQGEEGRSEGSQGVLGPTDVLGSATVQEEIAEDEGSKVGQGWARPCHRSGLYRILSRFSAAR